MKPRKMAVVAHALKPRAMELLRDLQEWARHHGYDIVSNLATESTSEPERAIADTVTETDAVVRQRFEGATWAVTLGGDGTILYAAHLVAPLGIPVLAVHLGSLGFHTQVEPEDLAAALDALDRGEFTVEKRMMLSVAREGDAPEQPSACAEGMLALNDVVVSKSAWGRMVHLRIGVDGQPASDLYADAFLVATPTGSSAYNYAARGPVIEPGLEALVLNAICPHRLNFAPIVLGAHHVVTVDFHPSKPSEQAQLLVDGRPVCCVGHGERLKICKAPMYLGLIIFKDRFFEKLREKLAWGGLFWKGNV